METTVCWYSAANKQVTGAVNIFPFLSVPSSYTHLPISCILFINHITITYHFNLKYKHFFGIVTVSLGNAIIYVTNKGRFRIRRAWLLNLFLPAICSNLEPS